MEPLRDEEVFPLSFREAEKALSDLVPTHYWCVDQSRAFSVIFSQVFLSERPNYELRPEVFGATRSNWTYHTAMAMAQAARVMDLTCRFETRGKRDAVVETRGEPPEVVLFCEWEWDYKDVFGKGKELYKLISSCKDERTAEGFLLTYCPESEYAAFVRRVAETWIAGVKRVRHPPTLFFHTIIFREAAGDREFIRLRTVEISPAMAEVWDDREFY